MSDQQKPALKDPLDIDVTAYQVQDPEAFARNMLKVMEDSQKVLGGFVDRTDDEVGPYSASHELVEASKTMADIWQMWLANPARLAEAQAELAYSYVDLWQNTMRRMMGEDVNPIDQPDRGDSRFKDPDWSVNPYFDYWKQAYLITTHWAERLLDKTDGLDEDARHRAEFHLRLLSTALSPSNFPFSNPEVVRETFKSNGENLVRGMENLERDLESSGELLKISQTDGTAFEVGKNLATTPGKVVFQNPIFQLIQYTPTTEQVYQTPILIVPPWINKFYILDLNEQKSFVRYLVGQGFTVFLMSWVNPGPELRDTTFEDYMEIGVLTAAEKVREETGEARCHTLGYCVGGTLLASTLAFQAAKGEDTFTSATFLTTQVDFEHAGDLKIFTDEAQLSALEDLMEERGYLDGSRMATVFNMMRPRDLIWPYIVNNYMLGKTPIPFDLLYWNQDSTRMPAANHAFYLRRFYHENRLSRGEMELSGVRLDLSKVTVPIFNLAAKEDHIAPAVSVYTGASLFGGEMNYVLAGSGHIAGVINPPNPERPKYQHWVNTMRPPTLDAYVDSAAEVQGSWWPHWIEWLSAKSGPMIEARTPGAELGVLEDAPGSYVKLRH
ncbi:MAG: class I poly(R)-hydroxyalkanoic acid synthase [Pseudomonadota bacterium]